MEISKALREDTSCKRIQGFDESGAFYKLLTEKRIGIVERIDSPGAKSHFMQRYTYDYGVSTLPKLYS